MVDIGFGSSVAKCSPCSSLRDTPNLFSAEKDNGCMKTRAVNRYTDSVKSLRTHGVCVSNDAQILRGAAKGDDAHILVCWIKFYAL